VFCLALAGVVFSPGAKADEWNNKTVITFSGPVEIPGVHLTGFGTLPAGTYVFKMLDSQSDRHIVQIFSQDKTHVFTTILAIPNYRLKTTDKTTITFSERPAGQPEALRAWFYLFFQGEDGIRYWSVTGVQTCALPIWNVGTPSHDGYNQAFDEWALRDISDM